MRIAFIFPFGQRFDGNTLNRRGLGGSEACVLYLAEALAFFSHEVYVFNDCEGINVSPGTYNKVNYISIKNIENYTDFDIAVAVRSVVPFAPEPEPLSRGYKLPNFSNIFNTSKHRVLWRHDTYVEGDDLIPDLLEKNRLQEVFTLSDWHTQHFLNSFSVSKEKVYQTRNGYKHFDVPTEKDPVQFVYNAAAYKGLEILIDSIWPGVKKEIPEAKLVVIGGWYDGFLDSNFELVVKLKQKADLNDVHFTGIVTPKEVAEIVSRSSFFIYPCIFPETFGISTLEAQAYRTPPIVRNIGALQTTALDEASYKVSDKASVEEFVRVTVDAYQNKELYKEKQRNCDLVLLNNSWEVVAQEWIKHFEQKLKCL